MRLMLSNLNKGGVKNMTKQEWFILVTFILITILSFLG